MGSVAWREKQEDAWWTRPEDARALCGCTRGWAAVSQHSRFGTRKHIAHYELLWGAAQEQQPRAWENAPTPFETKEFQAGERAALWLYTRGWAAVSQPCISYRFAF